MLNIVSDANGEFAVRATVRRVAVYLDNFALIRFATGDPNLRQRLVHCFSNGADLLFSPTNACEVVGPQSPASIDAIRAFLRNVGASWFPVEIDTALVVDRERRGRSGSDAFECGRFVNDYLKIRIRSLPRGQIVTISNDLLFLDGVLDWLQPQRASVLSGMTEFDQMLTEKATYWRASAKRNGVRPERDPIAPYDPARPATFVFEGLLRAVIFDRAFQIKKGDGADFCHACIAAAFARFAALDSQWRRRIEALPQPNAVASIYVDGELARMVDDIERTLAAD